MNKQSFKQGFQKRKAALLAAALLVFGGSGVYAADAGGIRSAVSGWFHGSQIEVDESSASSGSSDSSVTSYYVTEKENGNYQLHLDSASPDQDYVQAGGGVAYDADGKERPLTADEVLEMLSTDLVREDGSVIFYCNSRQVDLTDCIRDPEKASHFKIVWPDQTIYLDMDAIMKNGKPADSFSYSTDTSPKFLVSYTTIDLTGDSSQ